MVEHLEIARVEDNPGRVAIAPLDTNRAAIAEHLFLSRVPGAKSAFTRVFDPLWQREAVRCRPGTPVISCKKQPGSRISDAPLRFALRCIASGTRGFSAR
jgi:hypothetical protein